MFKIIILLSYIIPVFSMEESFKEIFIKDNQYSNIIFNGQQFPGLYSYNELLSNQIISRDDDNKNLASVRIYAVFDDRIEYKDLYVTREDINDVNKSFEGGNYNDFKQYAQQITQKNFVDKFDQTAIFYRSGWEDHKKGKGWKNDKDNTLFLDRCISFEYFYGKSDSLENQKNNNLLRNDFVNRGETLESLRIAPQNSRINALKFLHSEQLFISHILNNNNPLLKFDTSKKNPLLILINIVSSRPACITCFDTLKQLTQNGNFKNLFLEKIFSHAVQGYNNIKIHILYTSVQDNEFNNIYRSLTRIGIYNNAQYLKEYIDLSTVNSSCFIQMGALKNQIPKDLMQWKIREGEQRPFPYLTQGKILTLISDTKNVMSQQLTQQPSQEASDQEDIENINEIIEQHYAQKNDQQK